MSLLKYVQNLTNPALTMLEGVLCLHFPLRMHLLQHPPIPDDLRYQTSLRGLLTDVLQGREHDDVDVVLDRLGVRAEHKCKCTFRAEAENQGKWRRPEMLVREAWEQWEQGFRGGWHPTALVACAKSIDVRGGQEGDPGMLGMGKVSSSCFPLFRLTAL